MEEGFALQVHAKDNVATVFASIGKGSRVRVDDSAGASRPVTVEDEIPYGHKIALTDIGEGGSIIKYGEVIGRATSFIARGRHVHVHNIVSLRGRGDLAADACGEVSHGI